VGILVLAKQSLTWQVEALILLKLNSVRTESIDGLDFWLKTVCYLAGESIESS
jgi:hypothetical protein